MALKQDGDQTVVQKLTGLVEWYLTYYQIELKFVPNPFRTGKQAPEYDFEFWADGRRITEKCLAMMIMGELSRRNYAYHLSRVIACLNELAWRHYVANQEYPDWLRNENAGVIKRPRGRPRKHPLQIPLNDQPMALPVCSKTKVNTATTTKSEV